MKTLLTSIIVGVGAAAILTGPAAAKSFQQCDYEAQQYAVQQSNTGNSTVGGAVLGGLLGLGISSVTGNHNTGGNIALGAGVGAVAGYVGSNAKQRKYYDAYMASCTGSGPSQPVAAYTTYPPPSPSANTPFGKTINVRSGPGTGYGVRETLPPNTTVSVAVCSSNNWCQVGGYSGPGWVAASLLTFN